MTKVATKVAAIATFELTEGLHTYLQEQIDFLAERAVSQLGQIANWANVAAFQKPASFEQMFGNEYGLANDSNQKSLKYCAQTIANSPEQLVQIRSTGAVYGTQDASGVQSTVHSDTDQNKIQVNEMAFDAITNAAERYSKALSDLVMLNQQFGFEPTTSRDERYAMYVAKEHDMKRRRSENLMRTEAKFNQNRAKDEVVVQLHKIAKTTAHLV